MAMPVQSQKSCQFLKTWNHYLYLVCRIINNCFDCTSSALAKKDNRRMGPMKWSINTGENLTHFLVLLLLFITIMFVNYLWYCYEEYFELSPRSCFQRMCCFVFIIPNLMIMLGSFSSVSSVTQLCLTLCNLMDCRTPDFPVLHQLPELAQTHVHRVGDAIQPSHPLLSPSPAFSLSQHQGLFKWVSSLHQVAKVLEFQLQHQSFQWIFRTDLL